MEEPLLVALIPKRIVLTRYLLSLFAAVLGLGVNCKADSLTVYEQLDEARYGGNGLEFKTDPGSSSGLQVIDPYNAAEDFTFTVRSISVPALPTGAVVTSATFSLTALTGTIQVENGQTSIVGTTVLQPTDNGVESLDASGNPSGPCIPPGCAPTIATVAVAYQYALDSNCVLQAPWPAGCFTTPDADLLSLGISPAILADGFTIGDDAEDGLYARGVSIVSVFYPGFNSETGFGISGVGPQISESVTVNYTLPTTVPEPSTPLLLIPSLLALAVFRLKRTTAHSLHLFPRGRSSCGGSMKKGIFLFLLLLVFAGRASADGMDLVTQSGVWETACPPVLCSQTGDIWSYSFQTPAVLPDRTDGIPTSTVTNFEWYLNGVLVPALTIPTQEAYWFPNSDDGGVTLTLSPINLSNNWEQLFNITGCCTVPSVLVPGVYSIDVDDSAENIGSVFAGPTDETSFIPGPVVITAVPEPSTLILIVTGLLVLAFIARRNLPNHRRTLRTLPDCVVSL